MKSKRFSCLIFVFALFTYVSAYADSSVLGNSCDTYQSCIIEGSADMKSNPDSVSLFYYGSVSKSSKYNIFNDMVLKIEKNSCPPIINVYKTFNNVNFLLDTFQSLNRNQCYTYYANVNGDGKMKESIVGQIQILFCSAEYDENICDNALVYTRYNKFIKPKTDEKGVDKNAGVPTQQQMLPVVPQTQPLLNQQMQIDPSSNNMSADYNTYQPLPLN